MWGIPCRCLDSNECFDKILDYILHGFHYRILVGFVLVIISVVIVDVACLLAFERTVHILIFLEGQSQRILLKMKHGTVHSRQIVWALLEQPNARLQTAAKKFPEFGIQVVGIHSQNRGTFLERVHVMAIIVARLEFFKIHRKLVPKQGVLVVAFDKKGKGVSKAVEIRRVEPLLILARV